MAKKKPIKKENIDQDLNRLNDFIKEQNFQSKEELEAFMNQLVGKPIDEVIPKKKGKLSKKEESRELVYEAQESSIPKGRVLAQKAIELDPDNTEAYNYLAMTSKNIQQAVEYFKKAMIAGKNEIGEQDFEEFRGHFWGFHETRPFMKAKAGYADCLYQMAMVEESIQQYAELIELNPNDNQGNRYPYANILVHHNKFDVYEQLWERYNEEWSAIWLYTRAISLFKKEGRTPKANRALLNAYKANEYVIEFLVGNIELPNQLPDYYGIGDENEAITCLKECEDILTETKGVLKWVHDLYYTIKKKKR